MRRRMKCTAISEFHRKLLDLITEMEALGHPLFYIVEGGECLLRINAGDGSFEIVQQHFPGATSLSGGGGSSSCKIPEFDGSIPDGFKGEANVDEAKLFRFLHRARWVQIGVNTIYVWHGDDRVEMYELNGLGKASMLLSEEPTLEHVQERIARHCRNEK